MSTALFHRLASLWVDLPPAAVLLVACLAAGMLAALSWPWIQRRRERRRIQQLPPPPIRVVREPELKLPRRDRTKRPTPAPE